MSKIFDKYRFKLVYKLIAIRFNPKYAKHLPSEALKILSRAIIDLASKGRIDSGGSSLTAHYWHNFKRIEEANNYSKPTQSLFNALDWLLMEPSPYCSPRFETANTSLRAIV